MPLPTLADLIGVLTSANRTLRFSDIARARHYLEQQTKIIIYTYTTYKQIVVASVQKIVIARDGCAFVCVRVCCEMIAFALLLILPTVFGNHYETLGA